MRDDFINMEILVLPEQVALVYALLGGAEILAARKAELPKDGVLVKQDTTKPSATEEMLGQENQASAGTGVTATATASLSDVDAGEPALDAHGHPWSELLHATTKGTTKDGLWRMKPGVTRPAAMPGFPIEEATSTTTSGAETEPAASVVTEAAPTPATSTDEDDEFAAFRAADAATAAVEEEAVASIPARKWTDADLGKLCNQAAQKLGDPNPVKEIIVQFTPEGEVAHSRNIPEDNREDFAKAVEVKAGIEFAG